MIELFTRLDNTEKLNAELDKLAKGLSIGINKAVPIAASVANREGAKLCEPGARQRKIVTSTKDGGGAKKEVSKRTDTSRIVKHWVMFMRQGKKPFYVPISPNPFSHNHSKPDEDRHPEDYAKWNKARRERTKLKRPSQFRYQQNRRSTERRGLSKKGRVTKTSGTLLKYDSPQEIRKMRKISKRGLARKSWAFMNSKVRGRDKASAGRELRVTLGGAKNAGKRDFRKWTRVKQVSKRDYARVQLDNRFTYITKAYGNIKPRIMQRTKESLERQMKAIMIKRAKKAEQKLKGGA